MITRPDHPDPEATGFDGIICFGGEDWWYHNRGHFDMQMMRELQAHVPVLYVNSLGMRIPRPREGRMFVSRVRRKLRSVRRGLVRASPTLNVLTPIALPGRLGIRLTRPLLARAVRRAAERQGITRPLVWVACPTAAEVVDALDPVQVVYQRTDRYECFANVDAEQIARYDSWLKARSDLTIFCSRFLHAREAPQCAAALRLDHGIDAARFEAAGAGAESEPNDLAGIARPRAGFVGGIDGHTFDPELFVRVARDLPDIQFLLVGACSLPRHWCPLPNVHWLGQRPFGEVHRYMAACDVLLMPWRRSPWIEACNPVKLKEYLATGRPVVTTEFPELDRYRGHVRVATDAPAFAAAVREAIARPHDDAAAQALVRNQTWADQARTVLGTLAARCTPIAGTHDGSRGLDQDGSCGLENDGCRGLAEGKAASEATSEPAQPRLRRDHGTRLGRDDDTRITDVADTRALPTLASCVVLAGGLRLPPLAQDAGRHVLDLWLTSGDTVLDRWLARVREIESATGCPLPVRIVHSLGQATATARGDANVDIAYEPRPLRGPAGVLGDVCRASPPDAHVLVVEAARSAEAPLSDALREHAARGADITVVVNPDDTFAGAYVIRCGALRDVPEVGFVDLREQWLARMTRAGATIIVHRLPEPGLLPLRTSRQFLHAACIAGDVAPALADDLEPRCTVVPEGGSIGATVVCPGAMIGPGATVVDSILMPGSVVHANALVVRSLVCEGASVDAGAELIETVVPGPRPVAGEEPACA
ncbi:MAG: glycosyltransferase [Planctomycetes bacterium]|nr:glycosyltransferase [Planctomycetota bacterium]